MDMRELKALELAARARITFDGEKWAVPSQSSPRTYRVTLDPNRCECEDWATRQASCKHTVAARLVRERDGGQVAPVVTDSVPKRPTYRQNWSAYNLAQHTEKHRLQVLLAELCSRVPEPEYAGTGRRPVRMADRLFACIFKVYSTVSSRRFACDLNDATDAGHLSRSVHPNKVNEWLAEAELTELLRDLVVRSALPMIPLEEKFAVDSSGFSTSRFVRWFDEKYGVERSGHQWIKSHILVGCRTNVAVAIEMTSKDVNDCPLLPELAHQACERGFKIKELCGDKGYLSVANAETTYELGALPFLAPKVDTTGGSGGLFAKMVGYYQYRREEFLQHYHQRSNVESTFSAVKRKFGDAVRARTDVAMANEVLCKFVCFNLTRVILSQVQLGIEATFWPKDEPREPAALQCGG
jgi:transposase